jgi:hypothetical protein
MGQSLEIITEWFNILFKFKLLISFILAISYVDGVLSLTVSLACHLSLWCDLHLHSMKLQNCLPNSCHTDCVCI